LQSGLNKSQWLIRNFGYRLKVQLDLFREKLILCCRECEFLACRESTLVFKDGRAGIAKNGRGLVYYSSTFVVKLSYVKLAEVYGLYNEVLLCVLENNSAKGFCEGGPDFVSGLHIRGVFSRILLLLFETFQVCLPQFPMLVVSSAARADHIY
jgi:hypothetical protein